MHVEIALAAFCSALEQQMLDEGNLKAGCEILFGYDQTFKMYSVYRTDTGEVICAMITR